jgi:hypothetical protein
MRIEKRASAIDGEFLEQVARRVIALLDERALDDAELAELLGDGIQRAGGDRRRELLTVAQIAQKYGVHPSWVYAHKRELGAVPLGDGPRPRLRFDPHVVADRLRAAPAPDTTRTRSPASRPRRRRALRSVPAAPDR